MRLVIRTVNGAKLSNIQVTDDYSQVTVNGPPQAKRSEVVMTNREFWTHQFTAAVIGALGLAIGHFVFGLVSR